MAELFSKKTRKKKTKTTTEEVKTSDALSVSGIPLDSYEDMLSKIFNLLTSNNPELLGRDGRKRLKPPQVARVGSTRSAWTNFMEICTSLKRYVYVLYNYFCTMSSYPFLLLQFS